MKFSFELKNIHKNILKILYLIAPVTLKHLYKISYDFENILVTYEDAIKYLHDKNKIINELSDQEFKKEIKSHTVDNINEIRLGKFENEIKGLVFTGLVLYHYSSKWDYTGTIELTKEGKRIAKTILENRRINIRPKQSIRDKIFIACAFGDEEINFLYKKYFIPACKTYSYKPYRIDLQEPSQTITEEIMNSINEAECIIGDLTFARQSVYFEIGYAHGLGIPILLTCRKDHYRRVVDHLKVHFDLEQFKISFWNKLGEDFIWEKNMTPTERLGKILKR